VAELNISSALRLGASEFGPGGKIRPSFLLHAGGGSKSCPSCRKSLAEFRPEKLAHEARC